jgi:L-fucose isomerase-like protein
MLQDYWESPIEMILEDTAMIQTRVGFIVYGVHKDGLQDPMGNPFIDAALVEKAKEALKLRGLDLDEHGVVVASKQESVEAFKKYKNDDSIDAVVLFSGTWVWSAHMLSAIRDFSRSGKGIVIWTHPGSQGWRPVGGLVLTAALKEIGLKHRFVYGDAGCAKDVDKIVSYCRASTLVRMLNLKTVCAFGGRGMGQNCGVADPSQWTKTFGLDIDSRDTTMLIDKAKSIDAERVEALRLSLGKWFDRIPEDDEITQKSLRLYLAMKELKDELGFDFYTIQSFPGLGDDYAATCFMQSMMLEDRVATSTLSDFNTLMSTILLNALSTDGIYYGDLQHIDKAKNEIKIIGDGTIPPSLAGRLSGGKASFAEHGIPTEGKAGGLSVSLVAKAGSGVLARFGRNNGKFEMVLAKCRVFEPAEEEIEKRKLECGIPFWPHAFITVEADIEKLLQSWNNEYACLGYGDEIYQTIIDFCEQLDIDVIAL